MSQDEKEVVEYQTRVDAPRHPPEVMFSAESTHQIRSARLGADSEDASSETTSDVAQS